MRVTSWALLNTFFFLSKHAHEVKYILKSIIVEKKKNRLMS